MRLRRANRDLPPRMVQRLWKTKRGNFVAYYYEHPRDETGKRKLTPLGTSLNEAKRKWAEMDCSPAPMETGLMRAIFNRYEKDIIPRKAPRTQKDNLDHLKFLRPVFEQMHVDSITPLHLATYLERRTAKVRANREISTLRHVLNKARAWGYTTKPNPADGLEKNPERGRDIYVTDAELALVYEFGSPTIKDALDLAYLTGQRPGDVRKMRWTDIRDGFLWVSQGKTKAKLRIAVVGELAALFERIRGRGVVGMTILVDPDGQPLKPFGYFRSQFDKARNLAEQAAKERGIPFQRFQLRDLRAKAATDVEEAAHMAEARRLLGHTTESQTADYIRKRVGEKAKPVR